MSPFDGRRWSTAFAFRLPFPRLFIQNLLGTGCCGGGVDGLAFGSEDRDPFRVAKRGEGNAPAGAPPRVTDPVPDVSNGLAMPLYPEREQEWSHSPMVQRMWSPLQGCCLVAGETQSNKEIIEPETTCSYDQEGRKEEGAPRDSRAIWKTYNGRTPECDDSMGPDDPYQTGSGSDGSTYYVYSHDTQRGEVADAGEGALSQAGYVGKGMEDPALLETIGALEEAAKTQSQQPLKLTHKDVTQLQKAETSLTSLREQVKQLDLQWKEWDKYIQDKYAEQLKLYKTKRSALVEKFTEQKEKVAKLQDKMKQAAQRMENTTEADGELPQIEIKEFFVGEMVDLTGLDFGEADTEMGEVGQGVKRADEPLQASPQKVQKTS